MKTSKIKIVAIYFFVAVAMVLLTLALQGCMVPTKMTGKVDLATGDVDLQTAEVGIHEPVMGTTLVVHPVEYVDAPLGLMGWITVAMAGVGLLQTLGPRNWKNWNAIGRWGTSWPGTFQSCAAVLGLAKTPAEAEPKSA